MIRMIFEIIVLMLFFVIIQKQSSLLSKLKGGSQFDSKTGVWTAPSGYFIRYIRLDSGKSGEGSKTIFIDLAKDEYWK